MRITLMLFGQEDVENTKHIVFNIFIKSAHILDTKSISYVPYIVQNDRRFED